MININKCAISGYAMCTIAGTEQNFILDTCKGYTRSDNSGWTCCLPEGIENILHLLQATVDRAFENAGITGNEGFLTSLVAASNFYEYAYKLDGHPLAWEKTDYLLRNLRIPFPRGVTVCNSTACAAGGNAIVTACQLIKDGLTDVVVVIGYELKYYITENGMRQIGALSKNGIMPFSVNRTGTDLADGIGVLIIENSSHTQKRRKQPKGYVVGYGVTTDAYDLTSPDPSGHFLLQAICNAINMAKIDVSSIQYISAHGSGTRLNDALETKVIKEIFNDYKTNIYVNSTKSIIGHTLGASGVIETVIALLQMNNGVIHPTANFSGYDEKCDLNYCFKKSVPCNAMFALKITLGFGGTNVCIVIENGIHYDK